MSILVEYTWSFHEYSTSILRLFRRVFNQFSTNFPRDFHHFFTRFLPFFHESKISTSFPRAAKHSKRQKLEIFIVTGQNTWKKLKNFQNLSKTRGKLVEKVLKSTWKTRGCSTRFPRGNLVYPRVFLSGYSL